MSSLWTQPQTNVDAGVPRGFQIAMAPAEIRLEIRRLRPFVPGIHEDELLVTNVLLSGLAEDAFQPCLVGAGSAARENYRILRSPCRVVPPRHHRPEKPMAWQRTCHVMDGRPVVGIHVPSVFRVHSGCVDWIPPSLVR